jgi:hypothetical protein
MMTKLLLTGAALAALAFPASAQTTGSASGQAGAALATPPVNPGATSPSSSMPRTGASAETGVAANTSAVASDADLKTGATVKDPTGAEVGRISKVTKGETGTMVTLSAKGKMVTVPASSLSLSGGSLVSTDAKADIWDAEK